MTFVLIAGYIPAMILMLIGGIVWSSRTPDNEGAHELGDRVCRRKGSDRRHIELPYVGIERRAGERRGAQPAQAEQPARRVS